MAGDWMKIELELPDKPEVHSIASALNLDPDAVVGKLIRVWQWFDKHTVDGNARGVTYSLLDRITSVTGFGETMISVGWLEQNDTVLSMPKFDRHTSASAKQRALTAKRVSKIRNANVTPEALPREEKKRKDIKQKASRLSGKITLKHFLETCKASGEQTIAETDPVFEYAETVGLDHEMIAVCWKEFKTAFLHDETKRQKDWRAHFRNAVRRNWYKLWYLKEGEPTQWTSAGQQARRAAA